MPPVNLKKRALRSIMVCHINCSKKYQAFEGKRKHEDDDGSRRLLCTTTWGGALSLVDTQPG